MGVCVPLSAAPLLSGKVVDGAGKGIEGVNVHLVNKDLSATTGADGRFALSDLATARATAHVRDGAMQVTLRSGSVEITTGAAPARVSIALYELRGRLAAPVLSDSLGPVQHRTIPLAAGRAGAGLAGGVYVARVTVNGHPFAVRSFNAGGATSSATVSTGFEKRALGKAAAVVDSVWFSKDGCTSKKLVVEQYNTDLGDVTVECHGVTILPPEPPCECNVPAGAKLVSNSQELKDALASSAVQDVVLADGTYDNDTYFHPAAPHRIWGQHVGKAVMKAGIAFYGTGGSPGAEVHCLNFQVTDESKVRGSANDLEGVIRTESGWDKVTVTDCFFTGPKSGNGWNVGSAIYFSDVNGNVVHRVVINGYANAGIYVFAPWNSGGAQHVDANPKNLITDADISNIKHPSDACCNGTREFGIWLGHSTDVFRVKVRNADWSCIGPEVNNNDEILRDLDLDGCPNGGVYFEHYSRRDTVERFWIGPNTTFGFCFEWGGPWGWSGVGEGNVVQDGVVESNRYGVHIGSCNDYETIRRVVFRGQCWAAISDISQSQPGQCEPATHNDYMDNDFSGIDSTAVAITTANPNTSHCH
jgi:hypothetical protein